MEKYFIKEQGVEYKDYYKFEDHVYRGQMKVDPSTLEAVKHGYGHLIYWKGDSKIDTFTQYSSYIGYFENDKFCGFGFLQKDEHETQNHKIREIDGPIEKKIHESNFDDKIVGDHLFIARSCYAGFFKDNKYHGNGMLYAVDGSFYKGQFKEGKKHGYGLYIDTPTRQFFG